MSRFEQDITTILANVAKTFELKASQQLQQADGIQAKLDGFQGELYRAQYAPEIERCKVQARNWQARAATARDGYLLFGNAEYSDAEFTREFGDLVNTCQAQGRVVYNQPVEDQRIQQNVADGPYPDDNRAGGNG